MSRRNLSVRAPARDPARNDAELDAWLRVVTSGVDLAGVELRYTLPVTVEPWVLEFSRIVGRNLFRYASSYRDR